MHGHWFLGQYPVRRQGSQKYTVKMLPRRVFVPCSPFPTRQALLSL